MDICNIYPGGVIDMARFFGSSKVLMVLSGDGELYFPRHKNNNSIFTPLATDTCRAQISFGTCI